MSLLRGDSLSCPYNDATLLLCDMNTELRAEAFATVVTNKRLEEVINNPLGPMTPSQKVAGLLFLHESLWEVIGKCMTQIRTLA